MYFCFVQNFAGYDLFCCIQIKHVMTYVFSVGLSFSTVWFLSCIKVHMYISTK